MSSHDEQTPIPVEEKKKSPLESKVEAKTPQEAWGKGLSSGFVVRQTEVDFSESLPENGTVQMRKVKETQFQMSEEDKKAGPLPPLKSPKHSFALWFPCHHDQAVHSDTPGFRLMGFFETRQHAVDFYEKNKQHMDQGDPFITPSHEPIPICTNRKNQTNGGYLAKKRNRILGMYAHYVNSTTRDFSSQERFVGAGGIKSLRSIEKSRVVNKKRHKKFLEKTKDLKVLDTNISTSTQLVGQKWVVFTTIPDLDPVTMSGRKESEPCVVFLAPFDDDEDALRYSKFVAQKQYPHSKFSIVRVGAWIHPTVANEEKIPTMYGDNQLQAIMDRRRVTNDEVIDWKNKLTEEQVQDATIEL